MIGIILGFSAFLAFLFVFKNYHCAGWALVSSVFALVVFLMHLCVFRDVSYTIRPVTFKRLRFLGALGGCLGVAVFVGYLIKGVLVHETGLYCCLFFFVLFFFYSSPRFKQYSH